MQHTTRIPTLLLLIINLASFIVKAQNETMPALNSNALSNTQYNVATSTITNQVVRIGSVHPATIIDTSTPKRGYNNRQEVESDFLEELRKEKWEHKKADTTIYLGNDDLVSGGTRASTPVIARNFNAQPQSKSSPSDNSIAISNGGYIISLSNDYIYFYTTNGDILNTYTFGGFINGITSLDDECDPRVIYDSGMDRFILFFQSGSTASTSKVIIAFSTTNNPLDTWNVYVITDHRNTGYWFDYPNIGISTHDLFITGNLFDNSGNSKDNVVYQIRKSDGYSGQSLNYVYYTGILEGVVDKAFTLVPCSYGLSGSYGPGIYMISTETPSTWSARDNIYVWTVTNSVGNSPQINRTAIPVSAFSIPADAFQPSSNVPLKSSIAASRIQSAFYLGGYIHYVFAKDAGGGYSGIDYGRIYVANAALTNVLIYGTNTDYCYPSLASFGTNTSDKSVLIAFLNSNTSIYPEIRYKYFDDAFNTINSSIVKSGQSYVKYGNSSEERWGDYTGIQRRYNTTTAPVCWLAGAYGGANHEWLNYIAEVKDINCKNPVSSFTATPVTGYVPLSVSFTNQSTSNNSYQRLWSFTGGSPATSTLTSPSVIYGSTGTYSVSLTNENVCGAHTTTKNSYITVNTTTAINEPVLSILKVYPTPANNILLIEGEFSDNTVFELYNVLGELVMRKSAQRSIRQQLDISLLSRGIYTIKAMDRYARFVKE